MDVDSLSATEVPDTQTTVSEREREETRHEDVTEPEELAQYKWREEYEDDLRDMATKGTMSPEWPILANIIKSRLIHNTRAFLTSPPRNPPPAPETQRAPLLPATSIDSFAIDDVPLETLRSAPSAPSAPTEQPSTPGGLIIPPLPPRQSSRGRHRLGPAQRPGEQGLDVNEEAVIGGRTLPGSMRQGEAWQAVKAAIKLLDEFPTAPPFTIQRLCELAWKPFAQHTSIGKYLRAVEKNLLVTSMYAPDGDPAELENGTPAGGAFSGALNGSIRSRASSVSSASSTSSQSAPLFSPIPFLVERRVINPDGTPVSAPATVPGGEGEVDAHVAALEIDVDAVRNGGSDVSMGEGEGEGQGEGAGRPGTPMTGSFPADRSAVAAAPPLNHLALATSSVAALASNAPTTNGTSVTDDAIPDAAHEPFTGRVDELDAGPLVHPASSPTAADPHQLHLASTDGGDPTQHQEGTGERGTMTPHAMADRPQAISSTTDLTAGQRTMDPPQQGGAERTIRAMPRTSSVASSLNERFVAGETLEANMPSEEGAAVHEGMEGQAGSENPAKAVKLG